MSKSYPRVWVAGSRETSGQQAIALRGALDFRRSRGYFHLIHGGAAGADTIACSWAQLESVGMTMITPDWCPDGRGGPTDKAAGHKRNALLCAIADEMIVAWDGQSPGTLGAIKLALKKDIPITFTWERFDG